MIRRPPGSTRTDTLFPYTTLCRSNSRLREQILTVCAEDGLAAYLPDRANCTDNAAMVAAAGWWQLQRDGESPLDTGADPGLGLRSEEHTSELQSLMRISYAVFCLQKKIIQNK